MDWSAVDYLWIIVMFLSAVWTLILTAPIHILQTSKYSNETVCLRAEVEEYGISVSTISHTFINEVAENGAPSQTPPIIPPWAYICSKLHTHGVSPSSLAQEMVRTVNRQNPEVLLAHPVPRVVLYICSLLPRFFFAVVAAGVKDGAVAEPLK